VRCMHVAPDTRTGQLPEREVITAVLAMFTELVGSVVRREDEDGQGLAEYALILALIAIVAIVALLYLGGQISDKLSAVGTAL
jgi:pilus assembly protein Flp/PilA